jgi:lipopolysaccharide export system permease protein
MTRAMRELRGAWARLETPLDRYIQAAALRAIGLVAGALTTLFSLLEFVEQLSSVGQGHYRLVDALSYVLLTAPDRLLQVVPISMLLGSLLALGALAKNSELIALMGLGISEGRIIGSVLKLAVPITLVLFLVAEFVVPPAQQQAQAQRTSALAESDNVRNEDSFWAQGDHEYLNVQRFDSADTATGIDIYNFGDDGALESYIHADSALINPDGIWQLAGVRRKHIVDSGFQTEHLDHFAWHSFMPPSQIQLLMLPPETMPPIALYHYVRELEDSHQQAIRYEQELWRKLGIPLSMVAMIMIAAPFVFGPPRSQNTGQQITIGAVFGIVFSLAQQIVGHLDLLLDLNPAATAIGPSLVLIGLSIYLFRRAHR